MIQNTCLLGKGAIRKLDVNSLWRIVDRAKLPSVARMTSYERTRIDATRSLAADELRKRGVRI